MLYPVISYIFHLFAFSTVFKYEDINKHLNFVLKACSVLIFLV